MILLSAEKLSRQFDADPVFEDVTFDVRPGEKIGLVGPNGAGKSTLLNILAGRDDPDRGRMERHPNADVALLEQEAEFPPGRTLLDEAKSGLAHLYSLQDEAARVSEQMAVAADPASEQRLHRRYDELQEQLRRLDAYNIDHRVDEVLHGLGFAESDYHRPLVEFSGGQQNRALLARLLLRSPDVMLLDEPTNHLDIASTEWLERYLNACDQAVILVSHDRYFLDCVTNRILEMFHGRVDDFKGNFTAYWSQREERVKVQRRTWERQQEFIAKTQDFIRRNKYGQKHAQAADREKKLERLDRVHLPAEIPRLTLRFGQPSRTGDWVIEAKGVAKGFDETLFSDVTLRVNRNDRIGVLGPNGSGKTTLLRVLLKELAPDAGEVRHGAGVKIGYFDQQLTGADPDSDAINAVRPDLTVTPGEVRKILAAFGIRGDQAFQQVGSMSGGEKSRVALAKIAAADVNVLVLDEPTNHLDLWARASLEEALQAFEGTIVFVSHDRYFMDRVASNVVVIEPEGVRFYEGNYSDYVRFLDAGGFAGAPGDERPARSQSDSKPLAPASTSDAGDTSGGGEVEVLSAEFAGSRDRGKGKRGRRKRKFPYRRVPEIEADIAEYEELVEQFQTSLADAEVLRDGDRVRETMQAFEEAQSHLEELYEHWEEAMELN